MLSLTAPPSVICGRTRSTRPTSRRSTVWNGVTVVVPPVVAYEPVTNGTFCPTMMRASSLSSVISAGVERMLALTCRLERPREHAEVRDRPEAGNGDRAAHDADVETRRDAARADRDVDDVLPGAALAEVRAADDPRSRRVVAGQRVPLHAELGGAVRGDLDDQRLDVDLRAAHVELFDDRAQVVVDGLGRHHDQRVVRDVGLHGHAIGAEAAGAGGRWRERQRRRARRRQGRTTRSRRGTADGERARRRQGGGCRRRGSPRRRPSAAPAASARPGPPPHCGGRR